MYTVVIVEDEPWTLQGILRTFDWQAAGFTVEGSFVDPLEALRRIVEIQPDAVFTDIRMPNMTGLELIKQARQAGVKAEFVILSGYGEFAFAQEAMRSNVFDYCLKPIELKVANELLLRLRAQLEAKAEGDGVSLLERLEEGADNTVRLLREAGLPCLHPHYRAVAVMYEELGAGAEPAWAPDVDAVPLFASGRRRYYAVNYGAAAADPSSLPPIGGATVGVSRETDEPDGIMAAIREAVTAAESSFIGGYGRVYVYREERRELLRPLASRIARAAGGRDREPLAAAIAEAGEAFRQERLQMNDLIYFWSELTVLVDQLFARGSEPPLLNYMDADGMRLEFGELPELLRYLEQRLPLAREDRASGAAPAKSDNEGFNRLLMYVDSHYTEQLILKDLADRYFINQTYCSELFRKVTGTSFSDYVNRRRLEKAAEWLTDSDMPVDRIAEQLGYKDAYYFNRVFKKYYGTAPTRYRERVRS